MVGIVNLTDFPAVSRLSGPWELVQSYLAPFVPSTAYNTAGPPPVPGALGCVVASIAHTMPFVFPFAEIAGVAPGNPNEVVEDELGELPSSPLLRVEALRTSLLPQK